MGQDGAEKEANETSLACNAKPSVKVIGIACYLMFAEFSLLDK